MSLLGLLRRYSWVTVTFLGLALIYLAFTLLPHPDTRSLAHYHINVNQARWLDLSIVIPYMVIWLVALAGYIRMRYYSDAIDGGKDGKAFSIICKGILLLAFWLPASAALGAIFAYILLRHPGSAASLIIVENYVNLVIVAAAFVYLDMGAKKLANVTRRIKNAPNHILILCYLGFASIYSWLVLSDSVRRHASHNYTQATYYQPDWLIVLTIVIPRLIFWFLGLQAAQNIFYYQRKVKGLIYKSSLFSLSIGIGWVIISIVVFSSIQSLSTELARFNLGLLLALIYLLLLLIGAGYYMIAKGAKSLLRLEIS